MSLINATYIMSAKYPMYYLTGDDCSWRVKIPPHQSLLVRVLDLQLRGNSGTGQQYIQDSDIKLDLKSITRTIKSYFKIQ